MKLREYKPMDVIFSFSFPFSTCVFAFFTTNNIVYAYTGAAITLMVAIILIYISIKSKQNEQ